MKKPHTGRLTFICAELSTNRIIKTEQERIVQINGPDLHAISCASRDSYMNANANRRTDPQPRFDTDLLPCRYRLRMLLLHNLSALQQILPDMQLAGLISSVTKREKSGFVFFIWSTLQEKAQICCVHKSGREHDRTVVIKLNIRKRIGCLMLNLSVFGSLQHFYQTLDQCVARQKTDTK